MASPRISRADALFDGFIRTTTTYLAEVDPPGLANFTRLGMTVTNHDSWVAFHDDWIDVYPKYQDTGTRTKPIINRKNKIKKDFIAFAQPQLDLMAVSPEINLVDRETLHIPERDVEPTPRGKIEDTPDVNIISMPAGRMKIRCRLDEDETRASMHPLADAVEMRYSIGTEPPATAAECPANFISKKALFYFEAGQENKGKTFYAFCRYVNFSNPANNGSFTTVHSATVQG